MKLVGPVLVARDLDVSTRFYKSVLGLGVALDFGANKVLEGGLALQSLESWEGFIGTADVSFGGNDAEACFEERDFDAFANRLAACDVELVHPVKEHAWGQRVVRFRDPDGHVIEVGEEMAAVARRFRDAGMTQAETAARMDVSEGYVSELLRQA